MFEDMLLEKRRAINYVCFGMCVVLWLIIITARFYFPQKSGSCAFCFRSEISLCQLWIYFYLSMNAHPNATKKMKWKKLLRIKMFTLNYLKINTKKLPLRPEDVNGFPRQNASDASNSGTEQTDFTYSRITSPNSNVPVSIVFSLYYAVHSV